MPQRRWSDQLPPDMLREIAGRLHVVADFVRFHAVCKPWRDSRDPLSQTTTTNKFLPWLLAFAGKQHVPLQMRCIFSKSSYHAASPPPPRRTWVVSADGHALPYLTVDIIWPRLHDPLTGAVIDLPPLPPTHYLDDHWGHSPCGIVYHDGTILLYTIIFPNFINMTRFMAALLRSGDTEWTLVDRNIQTPKGQGEFCVAYHRGRIFFTEEASLWRVITPDGGCDALVPRPSMRSGEQYNYVLESHGELLWASVRVEWCCTHEYRFRVVRCLSVLVHTLDQDASSPEKMQWTRKDGRSLADRVLFLGSQNSFAIDASLLRGHGGCAYFVYHLGRTTLRPFDKSGVFRYNLVDGKTEFIERLPNEWYNEKCTWIIPQPIVAPIEGINDEKPEAAKTKKQQHNTVTVTSPTHIIHIERHNEPCIRGLVKNLPQRVKDFELEQCFFSKYG